MSSDPSHRDPLAHFDAFDDPGPRHSLAWLGFGLGALALGLQCANLVLITLAQVFGIAEVRGLLLDPNWDLAIGTPISWGSWLGSLLLLGARGPGRWIQRTACLVGMNSFDLLLWWTDHGGAWGPGIPLLRDPWVGSVVGVLQWLELLLFASLAADYAIALRPQDQLDDRRRLVRSFALVGIGLWGFLLVHCTVWNGWPPRFVIVSLETYMLLLAGRILLALTAFQVTLLCYTAVRSCRNAPGRSRGRWMDHELLEPQADPFADLDDPARDRWF